MKKLLVAAIGAAAAIGAFADPWYSGTSFESNDISIGDLDLTQGEGSYWKTNGPSTLAVRSIAGEYGLGLRSDYFRNDAETTITKGLSIKTKFGEPAYRESNKTKTAMGEVYVDVLVKPTICDDDPTTIGNDAKIAIWLKETESPAATNLMITAGYINSEGQVVQTNYNCGTYGTTFTDGAADAWQRFTIKSFATVRNGDQIPGFVVFRNKEVVGSSAPKGDAGQLDNLDADAAAYHRNGCLFPSLVQGATITAIGFDGTGDVDDILFTDVVPSFATTTDVTLTWDSHVTGFTYTVGSISVVKSNLSSAGSETIKLDVSADIVVTDISYATGYTNGVFTASEGIGKDDVTASTVTFTMPASLDDLGAAPTCGLVSKQNIVYMTVNGVQYTDIAQAIEVVNGKTGTYLISLNNAITGRAIVLNGPNLTGVTLDLNGQSITYDGAGYAITASKPLTITDSSQGKTGAIVAVNGGVTNGAVSASAALAINAGTFIGTIVADSESAAISGGAFIADYSGYVADGYEFTQDPETDLWVVGVATAFVEVPSGANMTVAVTTNNVAAGAAGTYYVLFGDSVSVEYTANTGYNINGSSTYTTNITSVADYEVFITAPTATLNTFTVTFNKNDENATGTMNDQTFQYNVAQALTSNAFVLASHTFQGWATSAEGEVAYADGASVTLTSAGLTLYAKWASSGGEGWDPDPSAIDENKTAAQEYPALAETPLAAANAKTLTIWAEAKKIDFSAVQSATTAIVESYLLNCAPADLEDEKAAFKLDISFDASGKPVVSLPVGKEYNVTPTMKGSNDLSTWTVTDSTTGYQFFKYELSL